MQSDITSRNEKLHVGIIMKLTSEQVKQTVNQLGAQVLPDEHPAMVSMSSWSLRMEETAPALWCFRGRPISH